MSGRRHGKWAVDARGRIVAITVEQAQLRLIARRRAVERWHRLALGAASIFFALRLLAFAWHGFRVVGG